MQSAGAGLDRDFYAQQVAADLGSSARRVEHARDRVRADVREPSAEDLPAYAQLVGVDARDRSAASDAWSTGWTEMVDSLCKRALHLIEATDGPVEEPDPLRVLGITGGEDRNYS